MSQVFSMLEKLLLPVAVVSLAVSLGDLSGIFHLLPATQVSFLLLMVTLLALGTAGFIQNRCIRLRHDLAPAAGRALLRHIDEVMVSIDPNLRKVWGDDYFAHMGTLLRTAAAERRVEVDDVAFYFKRLLQAYPGAVFLSTSSPGTAHLWTGKEIAQALSRFIQAGGQVKQIFFVQSLEDEASIEVRVALDHLRNIGVCVQVVSSARCPCSLSPFFFVESHRTIAWEIPLDQQGRIGTCVLSADGQALSKYIELFTHLWESPC
jgi:hypothetical protein